VDEKTLQFLKVLRELVRGRNSRQVYTVVAARQLGLDIQTEPGHREYEKHLADLELAEYLLRHPNPNLTAYGVYLITDKGIAFAEEFSTSSEPRDTGEPPEAPETATEMPMGPTPSEASEEAQEDTEPRRERSWWRQLFGLE
jgi:hypothetical protein